MVFGILGGPEMWEEVGSLKVGEVGKQMAWRGWKISEVGEVR